MAELLKKVMSILFANTAFLSDATHTLNSESFVLFTEHGALFQKVQK